VILGRLAIYMEKIEAVSNPIQKLTGNGSKTLK
jgi:hypothetical protein